MTPSIFMRHAGTQLKKFLGMNHTDVESFDKLYTYVEVPGIVVYRADEDDPDGDLMVLRAEEPLLLNRRAMVVTNPDIAKYGSFNSQFLCESGDVPTVYLRGYKGFFEEIDIEWLFRIYFIR